MSKTIEYGLLTKLLETANFQSVVQSKITAEHFSDDDARDLFLEIQRYYTQYGGVPSLAMIQDVFPEYEPVDSDDSFEAYAERLREKLIYTDIAKATMQIQVQVRTDPRAGLRAMQSWTQKLTLKHSDAADLDATQSVDSIRDRYQSRQRARLERGGVVGLEWPWPHLNEVTGGLREADFWIDFADAKSFKTWINLYKALHVAKTSGKPVLWVTREMAKTEVQDRLFAMFAKLPWGAFIRGNLLPEDEERLPLAYEEFMDVQPIKIAEIKSNGLDGVTEFQAKINEHEPAAAWFDGVYFLSPSRDWKELTTITSAIRQVTLATKVPTTAITQANKDGLVGYSRSFMQDCTGMMKYICEDENRRNMEVLIELPLVRDNPSGEGSFVVNAKPAWDFRQKRVYSADSPDGGEGDLKDDGEPDNIVDEPTGEG